MRTLQRTVAVLAFLSVPGPAFAQADSALDTANLALTATTDEGDAAWTRIHTVLSHPRCLNCHVGPDNIPLWTTTTSAPTRIHGMHINAGDSRIGVETLPCKTCHQTSTRPNAVPHAAPHTGMDWQLAPVEFQWVGRSSAEICAQLRDPDRNGGRDAADLIEHITHDAEVIGFITWSFDPGSGREPAPGSLQAHLEDMATWTAAGMPCPTD